MYSPPSASARRSFRALLWLPLGAVLCAPVLFAEPLGKIDAVVVNGQRYLPDYNVRRTRGATKTDTRLLDVPQAVTVVTDKLVADQAMTSMADVFRYMPGIGVAQGEGNRDTPVLRGTSSTADFYVDGIRDDVQYYRDVYNLERVEAL
jgi:catecholate siderophore receptor